jgi:hypothetical protein
MAEKSNTSSKPKKQRTRRQHWLPRASYLKHFTAKGKVTAYLLQDRDRANFVDTAKKIVVTPENIAHQRDLYETPDLPDNTIEDAFAEIEAAYGQVLENKILKKKPLSKADHEIVALYVSVLENRTPAQRDHLNDFLARLEDTGRAMSFAHDAPQAAEDWSKKIAGQRERFFAQWLVTVLDVNKWGVLDFCFLEMASYVDADFITCDHPVTLLDYANDNSFYGLNQWSKTAECVVPLTSKIALFGNNCGIKGYREVDYNFVREVNYRVVARARNMVISTGDIPKDEVKAIVQRAPQSLLLKFARLPKGQTDRIVEQSKKAESQ